VWGGNLFLPPQPREGGGVKHFWGGHTTPPPLPWFFYQSFFCLFTPILGCQLLGVLCGATFVFFGGGVASWVFWAQPFFLVVFFGLNSLLLFNFFPPLSLKPVNRYFGGLGGGLVFFFGGFSQWWGGWGVVVVPPPRFVFFGFGWEEVCCF